MTNADKSKIVKSTIEPVSDSKWMAYNELAWTDTLLSDPDELENEVSEYVKILKECSEIPPVTMLHLGCGCGVYDTVFKKHFKVCGIDISSGSLEKARVLNPEVEYIHADMRELSLGRTFDIVIIPDSIDYMKTDDELFVCLEMAEKHLKTGGVLLIAAKTKETFRNNNFVYSGEKDGIHVTLFENNHIIEEKPNTYEATLLYLIREAGELTIHTERHVLGIFPLAFWQKAFGGLNLSFEQRTINSVYDKFVMGDGEYPVSLFIAVKSGSSHA
jgi:ubiquinone/menaquinone biosynthesis C-methylase UbiE